MSTTSDPTPTPTPAAKTPKHHGLLDKHQLAEISHTNTIYGIANDPATFAQIQDTQIITPAFMTALGADLQTISQYTGGASEAVIGSEQETGAETAAKKVLLAKVHYIQSKAKIKYIANKGVLPEYGIGTNIDISRPALETAADTIFNKLKTDTLPKITAQHATDLKAASDAYKATKVTQVGGKGDATDLRTKLANMVVSLATRRRQLQHAADGEFPFTDPASAGMRKKFDLPPTQPLNA
jgi:hypothetical protein